MLLVDNGSIYTDILVELLNKRDMSFERKTPGVLDLESLADFDSFILSGRRHNDKRTNMINSRIITHAVNHDKKLLGICYGAEILTLALGGTIKKSPKPRSGDEMVTAHKTNPLCSGSILVFESHRFEISRLPGDLALLAGSQNCKHEIIGHKQRLVFGTQFHPEMSWDGHTLIERFCNL